MVEKLKSTLKRTRWSLLLKAGVFSAAWLLFPFWLFLLVALYLFLIPVPQPKTVVGPFFVLLIIMFFETPGATFFFVFGIIFFYLLLIKELVLIDRASAYEVTVLFLSFLLLRTFYLHEGSSVTALSSFLSLCSAVILGYLLSNFIRFSLSTSEEPYEVRRPATVLGTLLIWQFILAGLFLPVDFIYQTVTVFLGIILVADLLPQYLLGTLSRDKMLVTGSVLFGLFIFIVGSARWGL